MMDAGIVATGSGGLAALAVYLGVVQLLRFRRIRRLRKSLDAKEDCSEVVRQMVQLEFPFLMTKSLEFALFATYGVPSISKLLDKTGEFRKHVGKRYDDTDFILREYLESGKDGDRGRTAMGRLNAIHSMYAKEISNADMLFTLSQFVTARALWINRYGWRRCTDLETEALLAHYGEMGRRMGIKGVDSWKTWQDADDFQAAYAKEHFRFAASNAAIAGVTVDLFVSLVPSKALQSAARWGVYALIDPPLLKAFGFPTAPTLLQWFMKGSLWMRALFIRFLLPPRPDFMAVRRTPLSGVAEGESSSDVLVKPVYDPFHDVQLGCLYYRDGYKIEDLGPATCPAGRLFEGLPSYTGKGGGGSGPVICGADGTSPLAFNAAGKAKDKSI
ncbi:conserved unknown protein [Ectocarpus siliculosus]|uniref:ER-bound oxygenase mpaB/mpaB'/Rubber oxygenase catalytic domain-containing protein n=1 Tax=Ectocarpus siliculosus TaxID=2880 RepID=D8LGK0_ECTSI|nr:conserved unknown protein [Ectocarpus siliculosus]|eukprot:CBN79057.1 conserved unknown protein [Ectocarpus siliculosus]